MHAVRNIRLCTKDCVCLFVCPTGATDTETGQIDFDKCLDGCRRCVDACPSHAISLVLNAYPDRPRKQPGVKASLQATLERKAAEERAARSLAGASIRPVEARLARALAHSCRIVAEDAARESDYLVPQSPAVAELLQGLLATASTGQALPEDKIRELSGRIG